MMKKSIFSRTLSGLGMLVFLAYGTLVGCNMDMNAVTSLKNSHMTYEAYHDGVLVKWPKVKGANKYRINYDGGYTANTYCFIPGVRLTSGSIDIYAYEDYQARGCGSVDYTTLSPDLINITTETKKDGKTVVKFEGAKLYGTSVKYQICKNSNFNYDVLESETNEIEVETQVGVNEDYYWQILSDNRVVDFDKKVTVQGKALPAVKFGSVEAKRQTAVFNFTPFAAGEVEDPSNISYSVAYREKGSNKDFKTMSIEGADSNSISIKNLASSTEYEFKIGAGLDVLSTVYYYSDLMYFTTQAPITELPSVTELSVTANADTINPTLSITYSPVSMEGEYKITYRYLHSRGEANNPTFYGSGTTRTTKVNAGNTTYVKVGFIPADEPNSIWYGEEKMIKLPEYIGTKTIDYSGFIQLKSSNMWSACKVSSMGTSYYSCIKGLIPDDMKVSGIYFLSSSDSSVKLNGNPVANVSAYFIDPDGNALSSAFNKSEKYKRLGGLINTEYFYNDSLYITYGGSSSYNTYVGFMID